MNSLSLRLCRLVLPHVLGRACESRIPRTGDEGTRVNCFVTSIDKDGHPYLIALGLSASELDCIEWDGSRYQIQQHLPLASFRLSDFQITHYYGLSEIQYKGIFDFFINKLTGWPYIKLQVIRWLGSFGQSIFNKKKLITKQRMELLKFLVGRALDGKTEHNPLDLMTELYTIKWVLHPQGEQQQQKLEFYLDSLEATGELRNINYKYVVTGSALRTIEEYEEQERKHTENVKMQWRMFWLTLSIVVLTLVQADLIKLPTIIDLTLDK
jgi:hypothetical protein